MGAWNVSSERIFAQASDPGAVGAGSIWTDTDANISYRRNDANTGWTPFALDLGTAYQNLSVNSGATAQAYQASLQSLMTAQADIVYASAANTPVRLAKGTAGQALVMNSGATAPEWGATLIESAEQSLALTKTGGASSTLTTTDYYVDTIALTNPNSYKFIKITAIQWKNGATVNGNLKAFAFITDALTPVLAAIEIIAETADTAQSGTSVVQKANVTWSKLISGTTKIIGIGLRTDSATNTASILAAQPSINRQKAVAYATALSTIDTVAWTANTSYLADCTVFYKGYS